MYMLDTTMCIYIIKKRPISLLEKFNGIPKNISPGIVEGINSKVKLTFKKAFGFRTFEATENQLYHTLGDLPEPKTTHKFF